MAVDSQEKNFVHSVNNVNVLKCISANVDSLLNKRSELRHILVQENPDIVFISEVLPKNLRDSLQPAELAVDDYDCFSNCFSDYVHLGVAIYVKKRLCAQQVCLSDKQKEAKESVWVEISLKDNDSLLLGSIYRPPSNSKEDNRNLYDTILEVIEGRSCVLLAGDFNHPDIDWEDEISNTGEDSQASIFLEFVRDSFLHQHVKFPTHYRSSQNPTLIDLVFSSEINMVMNVKHMPPIGKSHHQTLHFDFLCDSMDDTTETGKKYNYRKADFEAMRGYINELELTRNIANKTTEESWNTISSSILTSVEKFVPEFKTKATRETSQRKKPRWWNSYSEKAKEKIKLKENAYFKWKHTRDDNDYKEYAKYRNQTKRECRKADIEYEKNIAKKAKTNPKIFYSFVNSKMKVKESIGDLVNKDGNKVSSNDEKAEILNNFFCSVFTKEKTDSIPECENKNKENYIDNVIFTKDKVLKKLKNLNASKTGGPDGIQAVVLKELCNELSEPLAVLFEKSMKEGKLPAIWKDANVSPIFKKGEKNKPNNYRPVSLTCLLCKIMESIIRDTLFSYLESNNLLSDYQHGFISHRSCVTNLLSTIDSWTETLDSGSSLDAIYLDFSKDFDSVPHLRLLEKLKSFGIMGNLWKWIEDFLLGRRQRVCVNGSVSEWSSVSSGVPQGSCLGPVLFVLYINDLPDIVSSLCQMYADDTKVFSCVDSEEQKKKLQCDLDNLVEWADTWQLRFNAEKCHVLHLGSKNQRYAYSMKKHDCSEYVELAKSEEEKDLGVIVDAGLTFSKHIEKQVNKANKIVGLIRRSFTHLNTISMKQLFTSLVRPHLEFGNVVWSPMSKKSVKLIEQVQHRATKMIPGLKNYTYEERLEKMKLPSLRYRRKRGDLIEVYKFTHGHYSIKSNLLQLDKGTRTRGHSFKLVKRSCRLNIRQHFFCNRITNTWNNLPSEIVNAPSINAFKARIDKFFEDEIYTE